MAVITRADAAGGDWAPQDAEESDRDRVSELLGSTGHYNEVAEAGGEVVGYVNLHERNGTAHLAYLFVDPSHQGRGIGTALMERALEHARRDGCERATLGTAVDNRPARAFYERKGWKDTGGRRYHERLGLDMADYALDLQDP